MMKMGGSEEMPCETSYEEGGRCYATHFKETEWNGTPAYYKICEGYYRRNNGEKEKRSVVGKILSETVLKYLPGELLLFTMD